MMTVSQTTNTDSGIQKDSKPFHASGPPLTKYAATAGEYSRQAHKLA
jgi:hypothetical protein